MSFTAPFFFLAFLPLSLLGFHLAGYFGRRSAVGFLSFISLYFYYRWNHTVFLLLLGSILINYLISLMIARSAMRPRQQTVWLIAGITGNLGVLCVYKYLFALLGSFNVIGLTHHNWPGLILPLGISFFTFTQISYLVDLKQGLVPRDSLINYTFLVTFFPHLVSGPIIRDKELIPQVSHDRRYQINRDDLALGLTWFTMGMFKKVMIADRIAPIASTFYLHPQGIGAASAWLGVLTYAMQLYFDFSGYSDMAVGIARMFSIRFPFNFNSPYKATNIIDFWQRWHITLTRFIMDYIYAPIQFRVSRRRLDQGKKVSRKATATLNGFTEMIATPTLVTLALAGVWHGAGLRFLLYGLVHGVYIVINHAWRIFSPAESRLKKIVNVPISIGITFLAVVAAQVFFRANSLRDVGTVFADLVGRHGFGQAWPISQVLLMAGLFAIVWLMPNTQEILGETHENDQPNWSFFSSVRWSPTLPWWAATTLAFTISMFYSTAGTTFLYFQF
jgi:D-alanyl-lipoteichoic acid acyltransferase DltB (MBOAT superfamily)